MKLFKSVVLATLTLMFISGAIAGEAGNEGGHGSDPMKDRFIIARKRSIEILESGALSRYFTGNELSLMVAKLKTPDPSSDPKLCFERKLCWYNTDPNHPLPPLPATLNGKAIEAVLVTTPEISKAIYVDIGRAKGINDNLAVVMMVHDAGHSIGRSDSLDVDKIIIDYVEKINSAASQVLASGNLDVARAECEARALKYGVYTSNSDAREYCSSAKNRGQMICLVGHSEAGYFPQQGGEYCSFIETEAQGVCMAGQAKKGTLGLATPRAFCKVRPRLRIDKSTPDQSSWAIARWMSGSFAALSFQGKYVGELYSEGKNNGHCFVAIGDGLQYHAAFSCGEIASEINNSETYVVLDSEKQKVSSISHRESE